MLQVSGRTTISNQLRSLMTHNIWWLIALLCTTLQSRLFSLLNVLGDILSETLLWLVFELETLWRLVFGPETLWWLVFGLETLWWLVFGLETPETFSLVTLNVIFTILPLDQIQALQLFLKSVFFSKWMDLSFVRSDLDLLSFLDISPFVDYISCSDTCILEIICQTQYYFKHQI